MSVILFAMGVLFLIGSWEYVAFLTPGCVMIVGGAIVDRLAYEGRRRD